MQACRRCKTKQNYSRLNLLKLMDLDWSNSAKNYTVTLPKEMKGYSKTF